MLKLQLLLLLVVVVAAAFLRFRVVILRLALRRMRRGRFVRRRQRGRLVLGQLGDTRIADAGGRRRPIIITGIVLLISICSGSFLGLQNKKKL